MPSFRVYGHLHTLGPLHLFLLWLWHCGVAAHYDRAPCQSDEIQGEVQGGQGYLCAPKCEASTYNCPFDMPSGSLAQAQCMLQDLEQVAHCGLLCQVDSQCPSGARCQQLKQVDVGLCLYSVSFSDWARQSVTKKLAIGWPSQVGKPTAGFQVAKTYVALQNLKQKYSIDDGDADMLTLKELLAALSVTSTAPPGGRGAVQERSSSRDGSSLLGPWQHDINQFQKYVSRGLPGVEDEIHDTIWNVEHITSPNRATTLLRGVILIAVVYVSVGSFIKYQTVGARGIEMLPHIGFWTDYPQLVSDGILYSKILLGDATGVHVNRGGSEGGDFHAGIRGGSGSFEAL